MSDTINALQMLNQPRGGGALPAPVLVNPLAAQSAGIAAAGQVYDLRAKQADMAWGQALQQATDANGNVDYQKAQAIAAQNPAATMGMQKALINTSQLRGEQINNAAGVQKLIGVGALSIAANPSDANVNSSFDNLAPYFPAAQLNAERQRVLAMAPADRQNYAYQHGLNTLEQLHQVIGQTTTGNFGGYVAPVTVTQPGPQGQPGTMVTGAGVGTTASPDVVVGMPDIVYPATAADHARDPSIAVGSQVHLTGPERLRLYGPQYLPPGATIVPGTGGGSAQAPVTDSTGKAVGPKNPPRLLNVPTAGTGGTGGDTGTSNVDTGAFTTPAPLVAGGLGRPNQLPTPPPPPASAPAPTAPPSPVAPPPAAPAPAAGVPNALAAPSNVVRVASANPLLGPSLGPAAPPSPLVAGDVGAMLRGVAQGRAAAPPPGAPAGTAGPQTAAQGTFAVGPGYAEQVTAKLSQDRLAADGSMATNYANNVFPQTQALAQLGRGITTAPGADFLNTAKGWVNGVVRSMGFTGPLDSTEPYDAYHKWISQIITSNPVAQGSDARLAATLAGNANTGIHELAAADMLKAGIALTRMSATAYSEWSGSPELQQQFPYYADYARNFAKNVDPRAFAWDMYNSAQKKTLDDDLEQHRGDKAYAEKLKSSLDMARRNGYVTAQPPMPSSGPQ